MPRTTLALALAVAAPFLTALPAGAAAPYSAVVVDYDPYPLHDFSSGTFTDDVSVSAGELDAITVRATGGFVRITPPGGTRFATGTYSVGPGQAGVFDGTCGGTSGTLTIDELAYGEGGVPETLSASWSVLCPREGAPDAKAGGELRYAATAGYRALRTQGLGLGQIPEGSETTASTTVTSTGTLPVTLGRPVLSPSTALSITGGTCADGTVLDPDESCTIDIRMSGPAGSHLAALTVPADTGAGHRTIRVQGSIVTPPGPPAISDVYGGDDGIGLWWSPPAEGAPVSGYKVYRDGTLLVEKPASETRHLDLGLPFSATHTYEVSAVGLAGEGARSPARSATTAAGTLSPGDRTLLTMDRAPLQVAHGPDNATLAVASAGPRGFRLTASTANAMSEIDIELWAPEGGDITPGRHATVGGPSANQVGLRVSGCDGAGTITVHQISRHAGGDPGVFGATYSVACGGGNATGEIRWASSWPVTATRVTPIGLSEGETRVGTTTPWRPMTLTNVGSTAQMLGTTTLDGQDASHWQLGTDACSGTTLQPGQGCVVNVRFGPLAVGWRTAFLNVPDGTTLGARRVALIGTATDVPPAPAFTAVSAVGGTRIAWEPVFGWPEATSYRLYVDGGPAITMSGASYLDTARPGETRVYRMSAVNAVGEGPKSAAVTVVTPGRQLVYTHSGPGGYELAAQRFGAPGEALPFPGTAGADGAAISPDGRWLAYSMDGEDGTHIWVRRADGTGAPRRVTFSPQGDFEPAWSPDGTRIAFSRLRQAGGFVTDVWTTSPAGGTATKVPNSGGASSPSWLLSGRELVVVHDGEVPYLEVLALNGAYRTKIAGTDGGFDAAVSPDGSRVAFAHSGSDVDLASIRVVPVSGGAPATIASGGYSMEPSWSPDGRTVYFARGAGPAGGFDVWSADAAGGGLVNLTNTPFDDETSPVEHDTVPPALPRQQRLAADFTGDGRADAAVFRPSDGTWWVSGYTPVRFGQAGDIPVPGTYDLDRRADVAVFRPSTGTWYVRGIGTWRFGRRGDIPVPADYDGDRRTDLAVFRPSTGTWYVRGVGTWSFGVAGDVPVPADYNADRRADLAVYRPSTGTWYVRGVTVARWGAAGDVPVPADYTGDGRADLAVFRPSRGEWHVRGMATRTYGAFADLPVPGSFLGYDRRAELAVFRPSTGIWYIDGLAPVRYGRRGDEPV